jgi:hypothetical protein
MMLTWTLRGLDERKLAATDVQQLLLCGSRKAVTIINDEAG